MMPALPKRIRRQLRVPQLDWPLLCPNCRELRGHLLWCPQRGADDNPAGT
jgi:hypothetical protein